MGFASAILATFTKVLAEKIAEKVVVEVRTAIEDALRLLQKYKDIDKDGIALREELGEARTDEEYKAILKKVHDYFDRLGER